MPRDLDVLSFGEALVDFFPERTGVALVEVDTFHRHLGGAPANVAVGLARLGARAGLMTLVGNDDFGRFLRARLVTEGVDVRALGTHPTARTGITFVAVAASGERSFLAYRGGGRPASDQSIAPDDVDPAEVERALVFHLGSSTLAREPSRAATRKALEAALAAKAIVSFDPNWRPHLWDRPDEAPALLRELAGRAHIVKVSEEELPAVVGTSSPQRGAQALRALGADLVVVTLGARGCYYDAAAGAGLLAAEPVEVLDATGAGDGFVAGLLAGLLPSLRAGAAVAEIDLGTVRAACALGNRVGARVVARCGATTGMPRREEL